MEEFEYTLQLPPAANMAKFEPALKLDTIGMLATYRRIAPVKRQCGIDKNLFLKNSLADIISSTGT
jgi:hypothetical protein